MISNDLKKDSYNLILIPFEKLAEIVFYELLKTIIDITL